MLIRQWHTSIRWRLPLSYALIALLAALALGAVLLGTLRGYYQDQEFNSLRANAQAISLYMTEMNSTNLPPEQIEAQLDYLAFVSQAQVRVVDADGNVLAEAGLPNTERFLSIGMAPRDTFFTSDTVVMMFTSNPGSEVGDVPFELPFGSETMSQPASDEMQLVPGTRVWRATESFESAAAIDGFPFEEPVAIEISGTPFGFGLGGGLSKARLSNQRVSVPILDSSGTISGSVELMGGPAFGSEVLDGVSQALVIAGVIAVLLAAGVGWLISRQITNPVILLTQATNKMASGDLSARVELDRHDEFGLLAHSFDDMAARVENTVSTLRRFVADAAHELQTPLTALRADLELALGEPDDSERRRFTRRALGQVSRLSTLADGLLDLSRIESGANDGPSEPTDLTALAAEISEVYASRAEQAGISFEVTLPDAPVVLRVRETQIRRALGNLLDNAIKFTPENGTIRLCLTSRGNNVEISVNDSGIGIAPDDLPQLFHRFHRGRNAASYPGSGLGLAIIKAIIDGHQGQILVQSNGSGTQFTIQLPAVT